MDLPEPVKTKMKRIIIIAIATLATAGAAMAGMTGTANASTYVTCDDEHYRIAPSSCWFPRVANASGYQMMPSKGIKWSSWGGRTARGRGTVMANSGYRAPATITLSRRIRDDEGDYIYTRITASIGRGCWYVAPGERDCDPPGHTTHHNGRVAF